MKNQFRIDGANAYVRLRRKTGPELEAVIDLSQLSVLRQYPYRWLAMGSATARTFYAKATLSGPRGKDRSVYLHRVLTQAGEDMVVGHRNGDGLDNRSSNLEITTRRAARRNRMIRKPKAARASAMSANSETASIRHV